MDLLCVLKPSWEFVVSRFLNLWNVAALELTDSSPPGLIRTRQELIDKEVLKIKKTSDSEGYEFTIDYEFKTPSLAAKVCMGRSANGRDEWKDKKKVSLKKHQDDLLEEARAYRKT